MKCLNLRLVLVVVLAGCKTVDDQLPLRLYRESGTANYIRVIGDQLEIHIVGVDEKDANGLGLKYNYSILPDGRVYLQV